MAAPIQPAGSKSDKIWRAAIMRAVRRQMGDPLDDDGPAEQRLERLADRLVMQGLSGDVSALREIGDRLDGKPTQDIAVEHSGELTLRSVIVSELNSFFADATRRLEDRSNEDVVSN